MEPPDKFSCLTKELWRKIMSFLPLEVAVNTSILSKEWREIWYSIPNLIFNYYEFPEMENKEEKFIEFIEQTLARHDISDLEAFELHLPLWYDSEIMIQNEWILYALSHKVKKICLHGDMTDFNSLPDSLFMSKSLVTLDLEIPSFLLEKLEKVFLPNLQELRLKEIMINEDAIEVLLARCPSLKLLSIISCEFLSVALKISASRLEKLILFNCEGINYNILKLETPMLKNIILMGDIAESYECMSMPHILSGFISFLPVYPADEGRSTGVISRSAFTLYKALRNAHEILLNQWFIEFLSWTPDVLSKLETISISKLKSMKLYVWPMKKHIEMMMHILSRCPNLRNLVLIIVEQSPNAIEDFQEPNHQLERPWTRGRILNELTHVDVYMFQGAENELEILKLLLENTPSLILLRIQTGSFSNAIMEKIFSFKRTSPTAKVEFSSP